MPSPSPRPHPTPLPTPPGPTWNEQLELFDVWLMNPEGQHWLQIWETTVTAVTRDPQGVQDELREQLMEQAFDSLGWYDYNKGFENRVMAEADRRARYENSAPDISFADTKAEIAEASFPQIISESGLILFTDDSKVSDHRVEQRPEGSVLGSLTTELLDLAKHGEIEWTYAVDAAKLDYLAEGEKRVESFIVTLWDQHDIASTKIDITLTGVNDVPVISNGTFTASAGQTLSANGKINFLDVDLLDTHTVSSTSVGSPRGTLTVGVTNDTTGTMLRVGEITWEYSLTDAALAGLAPGTYTDTFAISVKDGKAGGDASRDVQVSYTVPEPLPPDDDGSGEGTGGGGTGGGGSGGGSGSGGDLNGDGYVLMFILQDFYYDSVNKMVREHRTTFYADDYPQPESSITPPILSYPDGLGGTAETYEWSLSYMGSVLIGDVPPNALTWPSSGFNGTSAGFPDFF